MTSIAARQAVGVIPGLSALPWRDPHSVPPEKLPEFIVALERACAQNQDNADLHTSLGIAYAMNHDVNRSMDALEGARRIEPENFLPQFEYADLHYRLRTLDKAEVETTRALELAKTSWESSLARRQLAEIRRLRREGTEKRTWKKWLQVPAIGLVVLLMAISWLFIAAK
ncbi:MAG TPA: hypothetical protein VOA64_18760 [Candidatus Dormibacteraeota bacterium]|nr:hypothetical protein [Candidatus Dormibacteraeota bacterium]